MPPQKPLAGKAQRAEIQRPSMYEPVERGAKREDIRVDHLFHVTRALSLHANANRSSEIAGAGRTRVVTPGSLPRAILPARAVPAVPVPAQSALPDPTCLAIQDDPGPPSHSDSDCVVFRVEGVQYQISVKTEPSPPPTPVAALLDMDIEPVVEPVVDLPQETRHEPKKRGPGRPRKRPAPASGNPMAIPSVQKKRRRHGCTVYEAVKATGRQLTENYSPAGKSTKGSSRRNAVPCPNPCCSGLVSITTGRHPFGCETPQNPKHASQYRLCLKKVKCLKKAKHAGFCVDEWPAYEDVRMKMLENAIWDAAITEAEAKAGVAVGAAPSASLGDGAVPQRSPPREEGAVAAYCRARNKVPGPEDTDDDEDD